MARRRRYAGIVAATAVALLATGIPQAPAAPGGGEAAADPRRLPAPATKTVTLLSGDRVALTGSGEGLQVTSVTPGEGREHIAFSRARVEGREYVIPVDATEALARGRLDRGLFDVSTLAAEGYDDASRKTIPLIATEQTALEGAARGAAFDGLGLTARTVQKSEAADVWREFVEDAAGDSRSARATKLWLDGKVKASLDESVAMTGAPQAWKSGLDGKGVKVAVLDTGADTAHPDLAGRVSAEKDFTWDESPQDFNGHGTHVSSTVAGGGQASGGRYKGVAPGAELINGKVLDGGGSGYISWILDGMEWAAAQDADIVSMSLGSSLPSDGSDPLSQAVERLTADGGPLFVIAAGNEGRPGSVGSPGVAPSALTVGSVTKQGGMSAFSSQGPALAESAVKPELTAPGSEITAARAKGTSEEGQGSDAYVTMSGTSMATPHVAGAAAILKQKHPEWDAQQLKSALVGSADAVPDASVYEQGAGSVDIPAALGARVQASPAAVSAKLVGDGAEDVTRTLTYRNTGTRNVRLSLGTEGSAAVSLAANRLTVPAGGSTEVAVRIDASRAAAGTHSAWIEARGSDGSRVRTPVGIETVPGEAKLTLAPGGLREGVSHAYTHVVWQNVRTGASDIVGFTTGTEEITLPKGEYRLLADVWEYRNAGNGVTTAMSTVSLAERVRLDGDKAVTIDVSDAKPVEVGVDDPAVRLDGVSAQGLVSDTGTGPTGLLTPMFSGRFTPYAVESEPMEGLSYFAGGTWSEPLMRATTLGDDPVDISVYPVYFARIEWDIEAELADAGTGADLTGLELTDKIVLFTPESAANGAERTRRYRAILEHKPAAVIFAGSWLDSEPEDNIVLTQEPGPTLLRERLAASEGPVTLKIAGKRNTGDKYFTFHHSEDGVPGGARWKDRKRDLAAVQHSLRTTGYPNDPKAFYGWVTYEGTVLAQQEVLVRAPHRFTGYYSPGLPWTTATFEYATDVALGAQYTAPTVYEAGRAPRKDHWLTGPFGPALGQSTLYGATPAARDGDKLKLDVPMFSDAAGHRSERVASIESGTTELRNSKGELVGRNGFGGRGSFDVPARSDRYTLTASAQREDSSWYLGTSVSDTWTFRSGHTASSRALPLLDVRYDMAVLDGDNSFAAERPFSFGVSFPYQKGASGVPVGRVKVEYSTDDGSTWTSATVSRRHDGAWSVSVPGLAESHVSLRVTGTAPDGTSVTETVTRAFKVGCPSDWCSYAPEWPGWND
ncbi:S8 family peptidase [Streptomyces indicus]|uniref:Serine protease, subtilisin family n=1 Tax=Streptomyces indicus TaxID=417292 RepID=A0A1G9GDD9_9ACTN|nr:S8 family peptidase [Streptomyces indicus]SDK98650.1 Serine protease, subtilisin family [Streptomyces indicus]